MIVIAIFGTICAAGWTFLVLAANGMSSSPSTPFQGGGQIGAAWAIAAVLWLGWWFK